MADIICLNPTESILKCSSSSFLTKSFRMATMALVITGVAAVDTILVAVDAAATLAILVSPIMLILPLTWIRVRRKLRQVQQMSQRIFPERARAQMMHLAPQKTRISPKT
jgi:hypothetical protein